MGIRSYDPSQSQSLSCSVEEITSGHSRAQQSNVVLITIDSLRLDCLGCYGSKLPISPNIDEVAQRGILFENAYSVGLGSVPTRASMLTGLLPFSHGIVDWRHQGDGLTQKFDNLAHRFLPIMLRKHGYQTFAVDFLGEWHSAAFDYYSGMLKNRTDNMKLLVYGAVTGYGLLREAIPYAMFKRVLGRAPKENIAERVVADVLSRLDSIREPFFLLMHFHDTHTPYDPPIQYSKAFDYVTTEYNEKIEVFIDNMKDSVLQRFMPKWTYGAKYTDEIVARYLGSIQYLDEHGPRGSTWRTRRILHTFQYLQ
jgi:arylsulfatase A-like enzyme